MVVVVLRAMSKLANALYNLAESAANTRGSKKRIIVDNHEIEVEYVKPESTDNYVWENHYRNGNIYFKGYSNPVKIIPKSEDSYVAETEGWGQFKLITTDYYKTFMQQNVIREALKTRGDELDLTHKLLMGILGSIAMLIIVIIAT